jgi:ATP-binding cassette, subfamily B, bacterial
LLIEDGRIVQRGTHDQFLPAGGLYTKLYKLQFRQEEFSGKALEPAATA